MGMRESDLRAMIVAAFNDFNQGRFIRAPAH